MPSINFMETTYTKGTLTIKEGDRVHAKLVTGEYAIGTYGGTKESTGSHLVNNVRTEDGTRADYAWAEQIGAGTERIRGICEECGFAHKGTVEVDERGGFPQIACPKCTKETQNFNYEEEVMAQDREEGVAPYLGYRESTYTTI